MDAIGVALLVMGAAAIAFLHLRHLGLLALTVAAPVPGLGLCILVVIGGPARPFQLLALAWLFAFAVSFLLVGECVSSLREGTGPRDCMCAAFDRPGKVLLIFSGAVLVALLMSMFAPGGEGAGTAAASLLFAAMASSAAVVWLARYLPYTEDFIAITNRGREAWHRALDGAIAVAQPRWGFSVAGIGLVFAVLGVFGVQHIKLAAVLNDWGTLLLGGAGLLLAVASCIAAHDWRAAVSLFGAVALAGVIGLWGLGLWGRPLDAASLVEFCLVLGIAVVPLFVGSAEAGGYGRAGDDATLATARTHMRIGPDLFFASLSILGGLAGYALAVPGACRVLLPMAAFAGVGPLLFRPAFAVVLETCFPRRSAVERRYRIS